jgi:AraC-like DNA-binding protein
MPRFAVTTLHDTADLWLRRVSCDGNDSPGPREEYADVDRVIFVLRGRFVFRDRLARTVISPRAALCLHAGGSYTIEHPHGDGDVCLSIGGPSILSAAGVDGRTRAVSATGHMRILALIERLAARVPVDRLLVEETLQCALTPLDDPVMTTARDRAIAEKLAHVIDLRFDEHLTLGELTKTAEISVFHACRAFRRARNMSIHRYRRIVRLRHALALLRDTSWPLARVALDTGFANQGHLSNVFRCWFGVTPARARRMSAVQWTGTSNNDL